MKFAYFTDPHLKGRNPARRLDDYPSEVIGFFNEMLAIANKEKLTAVLIGGDIFDTPKISQRLYNRLARILKKFPCPILVVPGNHDMFGENPESLDDTMLGSLESSGVITLLSDEHPNVDFQGDGITLAIHGKEYTKARDLDPHEDFHIGPATMNYDWNFLMTHQMLLDKPFHPDIKYTLIKDAAAATDVDVVFGAHYHPGWGIIEENDVTFIHPGGTARLEGTKTEATRTIQYAYIDVDDEGIFHELRPFQSARPGKDILDITSNAVSKAHKNALDIFRKTVDDAIKFDSHDPVDILDDLSAELVKQGTVSQRASVLASAAIIDAEKDVDELNVGLKGFIEDNGQVSIEWLELENFQSHAKSRFDFDGQGLNAIIGASDSGKTGSIRALRWLLYNDPKGTDFIRFGASRATVRAGFSNGYVLERSRTQSSAGHYKITDPTGKEQEYTGFSHNVPIEVTNAHQMPKTELAKDTEVSLNIAYQLDGPFLMSESASTRASVIGRLTGVHIVDNAIRTTNKKVSGLQRDIKSSEKREKELTERMQNEFNDVPALEGEVNQLELYISRAETLQKKLDELERIKVGYDNAKVVIRDSVRDLMLLQPQLMVLNNALTAIEGGVKDLRNLKNVSTGLKKAEATIASTTKELKQYKDLSSVTLKLAEADGLVLKRDMLLSLDKKLGRNQKDLAFFDAELEKLKDISSEELDKAEALINKLNKVKAIGLSIERDRKIISDMRIAMEDCDSIIAGNKEKYKDVLKEMGKCPTCYTPIDDSIIDSIEL